MQSHLKTNVVAVASVAGFFLQAHCSCLAAPSPKPSTGNSAQKSSVNSIRTGSSSNSGISSSGSSSSSSNSSGRNISGSNSSGRNISPSNSSDSLTKAPKSASKPKRKVSAEQAIALVKKRADVKKFLALFPNGKSQATRGYPVVDVEELDNNWNVHVYEQTPEHTATMNWFEVNSQTGSIKPMTD